MFLLPKSLMAPIKRLSRASRPVPPDEHLQVPHDTMVHAITIRRSARAKRLTLKLRSDTGEAVLTAPIRSSKLLVHDFLNRHLGWITARKAKLPSRIDFISGALIPIRGIPHEIVHRPDMRGAARIETGEPPRLISGGDSAHLSRRISDFLKKQAKQDLTEASHRYARRLSVTVQRITIKDTRSRWGSCSASGALSYSWRIIMAPPHVLDYLAAHEIAHRVEMNHSDRYWQVLNRICPHVDEAEAWLKRHGSSLHRYGPLKATDSAIG